MLTKNLYPLISCICITDNRPAFLLKAIIYFDSQSYPNRELVISFPKNDKASKQLIENIKRLSAMDLVSIERDKEISLGVARNEAVLKSNGEYICTWDDDDWYSDLRLMNQYSALFRAQCKACMITDVVLYDDLNKNICLSGLYHAMPYNWAGTLLCEKDLVVQYPYLDEVIGEDLPLLNYLVCHHHLYQLADYTLYSFIYHGKNVLNKMEFDYFLRNGKPIAEENKEGIINLLTQEFNLALS